MERLGQVLPEASVKKPNVIVDFIESALKDGAHKITPRKMTEACWRKIVDIGLLYNMGSETTFQSVGNLYGYGHAVVRDKNKLFLVNLYKHSSQQTKDNFNLVRILKTPNPDKGKSSQAVREKLSQAKGGKSVRIRDFIRETGITDREVIGEALGLTSKQITVSRPALKGLGVDLPLIRRSYAEIEKEIDKEEDNAMLQGILDGISANPIESLMRNNKDQATFIRLGKFLRELGFGFKSAHLVGERLRTLKDPLPVGEYKKFVNGGEGQEKRGTYWIVLAKRREEVINEINAMYARGELKRLREIIA